MTPRKCGTLLPRRGNGESRDYEKTSAPQKPTVDISTFAGSDCKPIAPQSAVGLRAAVLGRRATCDTTTMNATRRTAEYRHPSQQRQNDPGVSGVSGGVRSNPPITPDGLSDSLGHCTTGIHGKESEVSGVSGVILKTIVSVGAHTRPPTRACSKSGFSKQPGHPGHLRKLTMLSRDRSPLLFTEGVRGKSVLERTPIGHPGHSRVVGGWSA